MAKTESRAGAVIATTEPREIETDARGPRRAHPHLLLGEAVLLRVALLLTIACYMPTLWFDFVYDDHFLLGINPWMESWRQVPQIFQHSFWGFLPIPRLTDYYRPLVMFLFACVRHIFGPAPGWSHLAAAAVHVIATYLTYRMARELLDDGVVAALAAALFGLHPTRVESAAWISGISDSLCVVFFLASLIAYLKWRKAGRRGRWLWASLAFLLLALFSKEAAVLAPVLIGIYEFSTAEGRVWRRCRTAIVTVLPYAAVVALFWMTRMAALRGFVGASQYRLQWAPTLWTAPQAILWYLGKQLWPAHLSVQYPLVLVTAPTLGNFVLPLAAVALCSGALLAAVWRRPAGLFLAAWFVVTLAPVILFCVPLQVHDRYAYLPSVASSIGAAYLLARFRPQTLAAPLRAALVYLLIGGLAAATLSYQRYWDDDLRLFTRAVKIAPDNPDAYSGLIFAYDLAEDFRAARDTAQLWTAKMPGNYRAWYALGTAREDLKDFAGARQALETALHSARTPLATVDPLIALGNLDLRQQDAAAAEWCYRRVVAVRPNIAAAHGYLAEALQRQGKVSEARQERDIEKRLQ